MISAVLNKRIQFDVGTPSTNAAGSPILVWSEYLTTWAGVYTPYKAVNYGDGEILTYTTEFTVRYNNDTKEITNKYKIYYNSTYYKILQISEIGSKEGIKFITVAFEDE